MSNLTAGAPAIALVVPVTTDRSHWRVPPNVRFFVACIVLLITLFALMRLGLILSNRGPDEASWRQVLPSFATGFQFDMATACYLAIPGILLCYIPWTSPTRGPRTRRAYLWVSTIVISVLAFVLICEFEFFREFQSRFNQLAIRYFDHPTIVGGMVWYNYPVLRYVAGWVVLATAIHFGFRLALKWSYRRSDETRQTSVLTEILGGFLICVVIVIGCRGGVSDEPLTWGDAFISENEFANQMSLNGLWCLGQAVRDSTGRGAKSSGWAEHMSAVEATQLTREMIVAPGERLIDPASRTVLRDGNNGSSLLLKRADGKPVNVVVVMMESFSARFSGAAGAPRSFTPSFDALAKDGLFFDHCMSAGSHTHQGIFATMLGFPNLPGYETLMNSGVSNQHFLSLPAIFKDKGYQTFFLYNGDLSWDNMRGFFRKQGVETFVGGDDMPEAQYRDHVWGVSDGDLFNRCNAEFEAASKRGPFMAAVLTLSNHSPFEVPPVPNTEPITDQGNLNKRLEALRYADWAVGKFIEDAKKLSYFKDTLFVFVGDHGFHVPPVLTEVHLLYHHVPLLFYAPGLTERRGTDHRVASHMNIAASIVGLLGMNDSDQAAWARSLFNDTFKDSNFAIFKMSGGGRAVALARDNDLLVLGSARGKPLLMKFDLSWPPSIRPMTESEAKIGPKMERELKAYVQSALTDLTAQEAGPVETSSNR